ncbi:MAG: RNA polymerase III subunit C82 [Alectoria sarmentosa]|nr:MAG: RNA polymerase III subunit C82 [Alectoria sarmentosa]CAD6592446.1 MAG: RNA polymerase III subunit C82 [Alectoria sarmentosa]
MSRHAYELCTLLVDDTYGELTSRIFKTLLCYGRLSLPALLHRTDLSYRLAKHGLSVLVQQHLVLWYTSSDDHLTLYEANTAVAYSLVRSGKYIKIAEAQAGEFAGKVLSNLLLLGHARVGDLVQAYGVGQSKSTHDGLAATRGPPSKSLSSMSGLVNGRLKEEIFTLESIHRTLCELLQAELVSRVHISHFRSDADNRIEAENLVPKPEEYKAKSKREQDAQHEAVVQRKLKEWRFCTNEEEDEIEDLKKGKKRLHRDPETRRPEKRQRRYSPLSQEFIGTTGEDCQPMLEGTGYLDSNLILRVNYAKFAVLMRNDHLVDLADRMVSTSTAGVYAQVLRTLGPKVHDCQEEAESPNDKDAETDMRALPQISTDDLVRAIKESSELANALGKLDDGRLDMAQFDHPKKQRKKEVVSEDEEMVDGEASPEEEDAFDFNAEENISDIASDPDEANGEAKFEPNALPSFLLDPHRDAIRDHLLVLAIHPMSFLHHFPKTSILPEQWTIDFSTLMKNVTHHALLETITSRHGLPAARLTRILFDRGKTDEKILCSTSLLAQKTMRSYLLPLHKAGMIGLQEVPRDNSRNPQRTNFLWFFDSERCKAKVLEETYKTMARFLRRARVEGEKVKGTVEKANRSDVIGKEDEFLGAQELEALNVWKDMDERIWGELSRLDDLVACLRDF